VMDPAARQRLADNIIGHASNNVTEEVLARVFQYWTNVDADLGAKVEAGVRANLAAEGGDRAKPQEGQSSAPGTSEEHSAVQVGAQA
jgi:catalase